MRLLPTLAVLLTIAASPAAMAEDVRPDVWGAAIVHVANGAAHLSCSGVLVQPDLVATAAHCIVDADAADLLFAPAAGTIGGNDVWRGVEIIASGGFEGGPKINPAFVRSDWALVRIAPADIAPLPLGDLRYWEIRRAIENGARLVAFGVDRDGKFSIHPECPLQAEHGDFFVKLKCEVEPGDSGGPVLLIEPSDRGGGVRVIGLIVGFLDGESIVVSARRFAPWLDGTLNFNTRALVAAQSQP